MTPTTAMQAGCRLRTPSLGLCMASLGRWGERKDQSPLLSFVAYSQLLVPVSTHVPRSAIARRGMIHGPHGALCAAMLAAGCDVRAALPP